MSTPKSLIHATKPSLTKLLTKGEFTAKIYQIELSARNIEVNICLH